MSETIKDMADAILKLESEIDALVRAQQGFIELRDHDRDVIDRMKATLKERNELWGEVAKLKAELEEVRINHTKTLDKAIAWKSKAEKLAEALKKVVNFKLLQNKLETLRQDAKSALEDFEADK